MSIGVQTISDLSNTNILEIELLRDKGWDFDRAFHKICGSDIIGTMPLNQLDTFVHQYNIRAQRVMEK